MTISNLTIMRTQDQTKIPNTSLKIRILKKILGRRRWAQRYGLFREKELHGLISRPNYAYGMLRAADTAAYFGKREVTVCEFGVAQGWGLLNMIEVGDQITKETGVKFRIFGFDTGKGLPTPNGYKDHPELWDSGDFAMGDHQELVNSLKGRAEIIFGDINNTIDAFRDSLNELSPIGFISIDVDIYSGTASALRILSGDSRLYLPAISFYFDDVVSYFSNFASGELCAIAEHNVAQPMRPIDIDRSLPNKRTDSDRNWHRQMYVAHILDHISRTTPQPRPPMNLIDHLVHMGPLR